MDKCLFILYICGKLCNMNPSSAAQSLNEQLTKLIMPTDAPEYAGTMEPTLFYGSMLGNKRMMASLIEQGVPYEFYEVIRRFTPFNEVEWASILDVSTKSLQRFKQMAKVFKATQSEKLIEMAEVAHTGIDTLGGLEQFNLWLQTPNYALGGVSPKSLLTNSYGKELVLAELNRINYGILA